MWRRQHGDRIPAPAPTSIPHLSSHITALTVNFLWIRRQPYSAYAVYCTTLSPPAFYGDGALVWLLWKAVQGWPDPKRHLAIYSLLGWMFVSKFSKNLGHYVRHPSDFALLPVSIMFGWFHGLIKLYAMVTLNVVCILTTSSIFSIMFFCLSSHAGFLNRFTWRDPQLLSCMCHHPRAHLTQLLACPSATFTDHTYRQLGAVVLEQTPIPTV